MKNFGLLYLLKCRSKIPLFVILFGAALQFSGEAQAQNWLPCPGKGAFKSSAGGARQNITFHNKSHFNLDLWWIDESGNRKFIRKLDAGTSQNMSTYVGHVWVAVAFTNTCQPVFTVRRGVTSHTFNN